MAQAKLEIEGVSIVLKGSFNPKIFQPAWFASQNLIKKREAEECSIELVHSSFVSFSIDQLKFQVLGDQFSASTAHVPSYEHLWDIVTATFRILSHTPIQMMGINRDLHFNVSSEAAWHDIGHRLAPKNPWEGVLDKPGMRQLIMEGRRPDAFGGYTRVRVEPSERISHGVGVYIQVNDHYVVKDPKTSQGCDEIMDILANEWRVSCDRSNQIAFSLMEEK